MKLRFATILGVALIATSILSADSVELAGVKSTPPKEWGTLKTKNDWEVARFSFPKVEGDKEDAELTISFFKNGSGSEEDNIKRQLNAFEPAEGKEKLEMKKDKIKVGDKDSTILDLRGTFLSKFPPNAPNAKVTKKTNYRELYVIYKTDNGESYFKLVGPEKTIEKHYKGFEEFLKNFK